MGGLLSEPLRVINVGLASFSESIVAVGGAAVQIDWTPVAGGPEVAHALAALVNHPTVEQANRTAFDRFSAASPVLIGVDVARNVMPAMGGPTILHAGPPVDWKDMCGPMQGAIVGAILYEGWATNEGEAKALAAQGEFAFSPANPSAAVGPMAGIVSPTMPVW